ncbi:hypothetical protein [Antarctobacter heliothermus]|uniref:Uncharacterized protein n=1 Tax=Antarctobacter heliothermus TaxID=74033 RepID=A0A239BDR8_9RHOB|nr:hypothetical protein [Antarctobacter heliothermus]SNS05701.1 hypothetical protein SAMN04488078_100331 [Antarctobacter heliothermus]
MNTLPPISRDPAADLDLLEDARRAMRRKALECLAEADRLDALYVAVTSTPAGGSQPDFDTDPDGDPN